MISTSVTFTKEDINKRNRLIEMYSSDEGQKEIFRMILDGSVFDVIKSDTQLAIHNYVIMRLSEIGLLDEDKIKECIKHLIGMPSVINAESKTEKVNKDIENFLGEKPVM